MERIRTEQFQGKIIVHIDFSGLKKIEQILEVLEQVKLVLTNYLPKMVYSLSNVEGMAFNPKVKDSFIETIKVTSEYVIAGAVVGASGMHNLMLDAINLLTSRKYQSFIDEESAKKWLVSQS
jgi:hypothetical protein